MSEQDNKNKVRKFYDAIGWSKESDGYYQNARYEDLRPISAEYIHKCHLRITPYFKSGGKRSEKEKDALSRHESTATVFDFAACASRVLRDGGIAYFCFTPQRLAELIRACAENRLEPKTLTNVHPSKDHEACLVLLSAKKNAAPGMTVTRPLIIGEKRPEYYEKTRKRFLYE